MIVGVGMIPVRWLVDEVRRLVDDPDVYIYPEFFDAKKDLVEGRRNSYIEKVFRMRRYIVIALYPDYFYSEWLCRRIDDVFWIFPLHSLKELRKMPRCIDFIGYPSAKELRDYSLRQFFAAVKTYLKDYALWYLGASKRELSEAINNEFDGVDVTTLSVPRHGYQHIKRREFAKTFAEFLKKLSREKPCSLEMFMR